MRASRLQIAIGIALVATFFIGLIMVNARAPEQENVSEQELGNIIRANDTSEFEKGFGGLLELVPDNGGEEPVPFDDLAPQRLPQYRTEEWLLSQPASGYTIQLGVFSTERAAVDFIRSHGNSADLRYFELPEMPDPVLGLVTVASSRFVVSFSEFTNSDSAAAVASILTGYGNQFLVRPWQSYQLTIASVKTVLARALLAKQEAQARLRAGQQGADGSSEKQVYQGIDPVEGLSFESAE